MKSESLREEEEEEEEEEEWSAWARRRGGGLVRLREMTRLRSDKRDKETVRKR